MTPWDYAGPPSVTLNIIPKSLSDLRACGRETPFSRSTDASFGEERRRGAMDSAMPHRRTSAPPDVAPSDLQFVF